MVTKSISLPAFPNENKSTLLLCRLVSIRERDRKYHRLCISVCLFRGRWARWNDQRQLKRNLFAVIDILGNSVAPPASIPFSTFEFGCHRDWHYRHAYCCHPSGIAGVPRGRA